VSQVTRIQQAWEVCWEKVAPRAEVLSRMSCWHVGNIVLNRPRQSS